jgi:homoserine kinase
MNNWIKAFAPATVSNVACGFDTLGYAIHGLGDKISVRFSDKPGFNIIEIIGDNGILSKDPEKNTAGVGALSLLDELNESSGIEMIIHKNMPLGSGLGSSASSAVASVVAINALLGNPLNKRQLLPFAMRGEELASGAWHADNVAPCLLGGMILIRDNETLDIHNLPIPTEITSVVVLPELQVMTKEARSILKKEVSLKSFISQSANLAAFIHALYQNDLHLMKDCMVDQIIEPQRAHLIPHFSEAKEAALKNGAISCSISGSGPTIFAWAENDNKAKVISESISKVYLNHGINSKTFLSNINTDGAKII